MNKRDIARLEKFMNMDESEKIEQRKKHTTFEYQLIPKGENGLFKWPDAEKRFQEMQKTARIDQILARQISSTIYQFDVFSRKGAERLKAFYPELVITKKAGE